MYLKFKKSYYHYLAGIIVTLFFVYLLKNQNHFPIPNSDFFQFINAGRQYIQFKFPQNIQVPLLWPFLISLVGKLITGLTEYPELTGAHFINILLATLSLINIYILINKYSSKLALIVTFLLATNRIFILESLNVTNHIIYLYFLTLTLLIYQKKHYKTAYFLGGLLFLIRYEGIVVPISMFVFEFLFDKKRIKFKNICLALMPIIIWLVVLTFQNRNNNLANNMYLIEIKNGTQNIPNTEPFINFIDTLLSNPIDNLYNDVFKPSEYNRTPGKIMGYLFPLIMLFLFLSNFIRHTKKHEIKIIFLILFLHELFLAIFPNYVIRYQVPIIWILYLLILNRGNKTLRFLLVLSLVLLNIFNFKYQSVYDRPQDKSEYRLMADWINKQNFTEPTTIFVYDPGILNYFLHNPNAYLDFHSYEDFSDVFTVCKNDVSCVINKKYTGIKNKYLLITSSATTIPYQYIFDPFTQDVRHHITAFHDKVTYNDNRYKLITTLGNKELWANIYQLNPKFPK